MRCLALLLCLTWIGCGTPHVLPPRTPPTRQMPPVAMPPSSPLPGYGRVVVEATDGPMNVVVEPAQRFTGGAATPMASGPLCRTPCVADVPFGQYNLYFSGLAEDPSRGDLAQLGVYEGVNVLRRAPGMYKTPPFMQVGPIALAVVGVLVMSVGSGVLAASPDEPALGTVLMLGGGGLIVGALVSAQYRAEQQAGSSTTWNEPLPRALTPAITSAPPPPMYAPGPTPPHYSAPASPAPSNSAPPNSAPPSNNAVPVQIQMPSPAQTPGGTP